MANATVSSVPSDDDDDDDAAEPSRPIGEPSGTSEPAADEEDDDEDEDRTMSGSRRACA